MSRFDIHTIYNVVLPYFRNKRFSLFEESVAPRPADRILDVGGYPENWTQQPPLGRQVDVLNLEEADFDPSSSPNHSIETLSGDGTALPFESASYDIVFSNSVIEHVGDLAAQADFAREARRVGRRLWIQTPARAFFFEPHYLAPFIHWLPLKIRYAAARFTPWRFLQRAQPNEIRAMVDEIRLLTYNEMEMLFPDCEIRRETVLGRFTKSYIAIRT